MDLAPPAESYVKMFFRSQFQMKEQAPPSDLDLSGQTYIVTGGNSGIGYECCRQLLQHELSTLIIAVRSQMKGEQAADALRKINSEAKIEVWILDLDSYDSIQTFATQCAGLKRIDAVLLNAGLTYPDFRRNEATGHEEAFQVNYLSNAFLMILLLPILKQNRPPHRPAHLMLTTTALIYVAKFVEQHSEPIFSGLDDPKKYGQDRYATSKLLGVFFTTKLSHYVSADEVVINLVEPGFIKAQTGLDQHQPWLVRQIVGLLRMLTGRSVEAGAWTYIDAVAIKGKESHCSYLYNWEVAP
jgi:NAD(P)-dependent dehydrogenase (short-subunit alcohol dehydrogenase family)